MEPKEYGIYQNREVVILQKREVLPGLTIARIAVLDVTNPFRFEVGGDDDGPSYMTSELVVFANMSEVTNISSAPSAALVELLDDRAEYQQRAETYTMGMGA